MKNFGILYCPQIAQITTDFKERFFSKAMDF